MGGREVGYLFGQYKRITNRGETADEYGSPGIYVTGANIAGFPRVADAMLAFGIIWPN